MGGTTEGPSGAEAAKHGRPARSQRTNFRKISREALLQVEVLCHRWLPDGKRSGAWWSARNPLRADRHASFAISLTTGRWRDYATGDHGSDLISLLAYLTGISQYEAALRLEAELATSLGHSGPIDHKRPSRQQELQRNHEQARQCWRESRPSAGKPVEAYLRSRGITIPIPPSIRFHPCLKYGPTGQLLSAMVAAVQGADRRVTGIHRTFLQGSSKAPVPKPKLMLGSCAGGAVRLGPLADEIHVCEGIETGLAAMQVTGLPTWAALSTAGLRSLLLPSSVRKIIILADNDDPGLDAADQVARRWIGEGRHVRIAKPPAGQDMADLLLEEKP